MRLKFKNAFFSFFVCALFLASAFQAQAFYLDVPKSVSENFNKLKKLIVQPKVLGESVSSDANGMNVQPPVETREAKTCNVNGVEIQGSCENYNSGSGQPQYNEKNNEEMQKKDQERWLNDMKRGNKDMERNLSRLSNAFKKAEKSGTVMPQEIKDKFAQANEIMNLLKNAQTAEEMQNIDMQGLGDLMRELDESREVLIDQAQRLKDMKRGLKDITRELGKFEKQVEKLKKQKTVIPEELPAVFNKIKSTVAAIQNAKTYEEAVAAGIEDMRELWEALDENRQKLEMLSRWPQTLKEVDKQLKQIAKELQKAKKTADMANKNGIDLSELYNEFEDSVNKLKSAKDDALKKMSEADGEGAFEIIENDFFNQMEDVWARQRIISTLSNLGRFKSDFKKGLSESHRLMAKLKSKKIDVSELEKFIVYAAAKGNEIESLLKAKPVDLDKIIDLLNEAEILRQEFYENASDLAGDAIMMPWENGPALFKMPELPDSVNKIMPKNAECDCKCGEENKK